MVTVKTLYAIYSRTKKKFKGRAAYLWTDYPVQTYKTKGLAFSALKKAFGDVDYYMDMNTQWGLEKAEYFQRKIDELDLVVIDLTIRWEVPNDSHD